MSYQVASDQIAFLAHHLTLEQLPDVIRSRSFGKLLLKYTTDTSKRAAIELMIVDMKDDQIDQGQNLFF